MSLFPITPVLDDFNRPDEAPPTNWTASIPASLGIVSQELACIFAPGSDVVGYYDVQTFGPDCENRIDLIAVPEDGGQFFLYIRESADYGATDGYYIAVYRDDAGDDTITLVHARTSTILGTCIITLQAGDSFGLRCMGNYIDVWYKPVGGIWSPAIATMSSLSVGAGYFGVFVQASTTRLDNLGGGTLLTPYNSIFTCDVRID